jgi:hypothetical protein
MGEGRPAQPGGPPGLGLALALKHSKVVQVLLKDLRPGPPASQVGKLRQGAAPV